VGSYVRKSPVVVECVEGGWRGKSRGNGLHRCPSEGKKQVNWNPVKLGSRKIVTNGLVTKKYREKGLGRNKPRLLKKRK